MQVLRFLDRIYVYMWMSCHSITISHTAKPYCSVTRSWNKFEVSHGWGCPFNAKELGSAVESFKKVACAVKSHLKPKAKAKAKAKANASPA